MRQSNFALRLQPSLYEAARDLAKEEGVALNQLINVAVAQMLATSRASNYIAIRSRRANVQEGRDILERAGGENPPIEGDELPGSLQTAKAPARAKAAKARITTRSKSRK
jgi:hypothetical protein